MLLQIRKHEEISVLMFKKILLEHPKVLIEFVNSNLDKGHVVMIENMINCSKDVMVRLTTSKCPLKWIAANNAISVWYSTNMNDAGSSRAMYTLPVLI